MAQETGPAIEPVAETTARGSYFSEHPQVKYLLLAALLLLAIVVIVAWSYYSARESTDDAQIDGHIHPINARVGGTVTQVNVDDNQYVEAGTLLAEIDPRDYQVALERARADLAVAVAGREATAAEVPITSTATTSQLSEAQAGVAVGEAGVAAAQKQQQAAEARVASAQARVRQAQANYTRAARDLERLRPLLAKEEISQQQYDATEAAAAALQAEVDAAQAQLSEAEQGVHLASSQVAQAQARVREAQAREQATGSAPQKLQAARAQTKSAEARIKQAEANLAQQQLNLGYTRVVAPISGVVSRKSVEVGQTVQPGQPLLAIVSLDDLWVTANFKETQLENIRPGQKAIVSVDAYGGKDYTGRVESIAGATGARFSLLPPENATGNYVKVVQRIPVKIVFDKGQDPNHLLRPGLSVVPTVLIK